MVRLSEHSSAHAIQAGLPSPGGPRASEPAMLRPARARFAVPRHACRAKPLVPRPQQLPAAVEAEPPDALAIHGKNVLVAVPLHVAV